MIAAEIEVPVAFCEIYGMYISPYTTAARYAAITAALAVGGVLERPIVRSISGGKFQVLSGWDLVYEYQQSGIERITVHHADYSDADAIYYSIVEQSQMLGLSWIHVARALHKVKIQLSWTDYAIAAATRNAYDRTSVSRLIKISSKLSPRLQTLAESGRLSLSAGRKLTTLSASKQDLIATEIIEKSLSYSQIMERYFPSTRSKIVNLPTLGRIKSVDIKNAEETLAAILGSPIDIQDDPSVPGSGTINCEFFNRPQLIGLINLFLRNMKRGATPAGTFSVNFRNLDEFDLLVGNHLSREERD